MEAINKNKPLWLSILRWSARVSSIPFIGFAIFLLIELHIESSWSNEYMVFTVFAPLILYIIGLVIGVWREGSGGLISLVFLAFGIIYHAVEGTEVLMFCSMFIASLLYILSWYYHRRWARQQ